MLIFLLINVVAMLTSASAALSLQATLIFGAALLLGAAHRYHLADGIERRRQRNNPIKLAQSFAFNSGFLGAVTGLLLAIALPKVGQIDQIMLAVSGSIQIAGIAFTTRTLPAAAYAHVVQMALGLLFGFLQIGGMETVGLGVLIFAATFLQGGMIHVAHRTFVHRLMQERQHHESSATVRMLLNDFEAQGSDWLFELDTDGRMAKVSEKFAEAAERKAEDMNGRIFASLFLEGPERRQLQDHISNRRAFRNLLVEVARPSNRENIWWSISLRPVSSGVTTRFRGVISDVSAEKKAEARVRHMAHYDSLTGLPNRLMLTSFLNKMLDMVGGDRRMAILAIDCDDFKSINDMYGHPMGDAFLQQASQRLSATVASSKLGEESLVARLGGDEFAVLIGGEDTFDHVTRLAQRIVEAFQQPCVVDGIEVTSSVSVGIAIAPEHGRTSAELMSFADMALYEAKEAGRSRWEMFAPGMDVVIHKRHGIARDLRTAVVNGELRLYLQPLVNVETGRNSGFEALMRWEHPERGLVMPDDFIPVAEDTGLIVPMGEWMIRTALAEAVSWDDPHVIAINLSPIQLRSTTLLPTIVNALAETGIDPARVELEITETVLLHESESNIAVLNKLHDLGLKIALDDFGTGYASLNYLLTFPFDKIKIDRSFVNDLENRADAQAIVSAVISLANQLGMCTLAEGVENDSQLVRLRSQGCEMVQGWLFGKAMPAQHYRGDLIKRRRVRKAA